MKNTLSKIISIIVLTLLLVPCFSACNSGKTLLYSKTVESVTVTRTSDGAVVTLTGEEAESYVSRFSGIEMSVDTLLHGLNATLTPHYTVTINYVKPKIGKAKTSTFTVGETSVRQNGNTEYNYPRRVQKGNYAGSCSEDAVTATTNLFL